MWDDASGASRRADIKSAVQVRSLHKPGRYADGNGLYLVRERSVERRWVSRHLSPGEAFAPIWALSLSARYRLPKPARRRWLTESSPARVAIPWPSGTGPGRFRADVR